MSDLSSADSPADSPADEAIRAASPALWEALSPLGRRVRQPVHFLPLQTAEARGKPFNATIGQITDGHGRAVPLPSMAAALAGLDEEERSRAFLYSPVEGMADLRQAWRERQRLPQASLPIVTAGAEQALGLAAQLFAAPGRPSVLLVDDRPGLRDLLEIRIGADLLLSLESLPDGVPAFAVVPPGARSADLLAAASRGPLVVTVDAACPSPEADAGRILFRELLGASPSLIPWLVEGSEELGFPGGRVGFLTSPFPPDSAAAQGLESKIKMLLRAELGSPPAATQRLVLRSI
jgi:hypothetical protein